VTKDSSLCVSGDFSPSICWADVLINLDTLNSDILKLVPWMLKCNVPIWFFWGSHISLCHLTGGASFIDHFCHTQAEINEALITRQITIDPMPTPNPIFPPTENPVPPPSVDPFLALSSSQIVSSSACLT
jgi:hypothetical protein